jgi:DNA-directed RNA polymerase specialized sigma54-like protein
VSFDILASAFELTERRVTRDEKMILMVLANASDMDGFCRIDFRKIMKYACMREKKMFDVLNRLIDKKMIHPDTDGIWLNLTNGKF